MFETLPIYPGHLKGLHDHTSRFRFQKIQPWLNITSWGAPNATPWPYRKQLHSYFKQRLIQIDKSTKDWSLKRKIKKNTKSINKKTNEKWNKNQPKRKQKSIENRPKINQKTSKNHSWRGLGGALGPRPKKTQKNKNFWPHLGLSWRRLGDLLAPSWPLDRRLGPSWAVLGPSWALLKSM